MSEQHDPRARPDANAAERKSLPLHDALDCIDEGLTLFDPDERMVLANARTRSNLAPVADLLQPGFTFEDILRAGIAHGVFPEAEGREEAFVAERLAHFRAADGTPLEASTYDGRWVLLRVTRMPDGGRVLVRTDVTDLKHTEAALSARARQQAAAAALGHSALRGTPLDALMAEAVAAIREIIATPFCKVFEIASETRDSMLLVAGYGWRKGYIGRHRYYRPDIYRGSYTLRAGKPLVVLDWSKADRPPPDFLQDHAIVSSVTVPILGADSYYGILGVDSDVPRSFTEDEVEFLQLIANIIGIAVQRKHHAEGLRRADQQVATILDSSPVAIISVDGESRVTTWNRAAESIFGFSAEEVIGRTYPLIPPVAESEHRRLRDAVHSGRSLHNVEVQRRRKDGKLLRVLLSAVPLRDEDGRVNGLTCTLEDITDRRRTEEQLRHAQKMEAIGVLTGGIAHDFNNILSVVIGNLDLLQGALKASPGVQDLAQTALQGALRGADLTQQLLAFARRQDLEPRPTDVNALLRDTVKLLERTLGATIDIRLSLTPDPWPVMIDPTQLDAAVMNLALNARDAMPEGGILTLATRNAMADEIAWDDKLDVRAGGYVVLEVSDNGSGIPPELLDRLFEPFFTTKPGAKGTGLGLPMVYGFVKQSGGHISVYSEVGHGTTFRLYIPRTDPDTVQDRPCDEPAPTATDSNGERILVVEDNPAVRQVAVRQLSALGYAVVEVGSAAQALRFLESDPGIQLVFSDVVMTGGMSGQDLALAIAERWPHIKLLLTSGYPEMVVRSRKDIAADILSKPYRQADLARKVRAVLDS